MTQIITATFEDGVFKPDAKLDLATGAKVQLVVTLSLGNNGQVQPDTQLPPAPSGGDSLAREQLRERIQREWDESFEQRQKALADWERLCDEDPIVSIEPHMTREQLHERR